jgi:ppGpp synthetase/RelA/SpoT-type nucleotidyltranferase
LDANLRSKLAELEWALSYYLRAKEMNDPRVEEKRKKFEELRLEFELKFPSYKEHMEARVKDIESGFEKAKRARKIQSGYQKEE